MGHSGVGKYLDCSTVHISPKTMRELEQDKVEYASAYYLFPEGAWLYACDDDGLYPDQPEDLVILYKYALSLGCSWIKLDCDGYEHTDLPKYDWDAPEVAE